MKELVVISGKGGTGRTSIIASFAALADRIVLADCDVDAANLHLVLEPRTLRRESLSGGKRARIDPDRCIGCGKCAELCRFGAVSSGFPRQIDAGDMRVSSACSNCTYCKRSCSARVNSEIEAMIHASNSAVAPQFTIDPIACEGCGVCVWFCPADAIEFAPAVNGEWCVSETRHGPMVHAKLGVAEGNSGKLVSTVRGEAKELAQRHSADLILVDGAPGVGCPANASVAGADLVLIVTEPTLSGLHVLGSVVDVVKRSGVPGLVCVNKWDINPDIAAEIERQAVAHGLRIAGRIRYDRAVTDAQIRKLSVVEYQQDGCVEDITQLWATTRERLRELNLPEPGVTLNG